jgi:hypothetical protein
MTQVNVEKVLCNSKHENMFAFFSLQWKTYNFLKQIIIDLIHRCKLRLKHTLRMLSPFTRVSILADCLVFHNWTCDHRSVEDPEISKRGARSGEGVVAPLKNGFKKFRYFGSEILNFTHNRWMNHVAHRANSILQKSSPQSGMHWLRFSVRACIDSHPCIRAYTDTGGKQVRFVSFRK